jgi:hypothetical protein
VGQACRRKECRVAHDLPTEDEDRVTDDSLRYTCGRHVARSSCSTRSPLCPSLSPIALRWDVAVTIGPDRTRAIRSHRGGNEEEGSRRPPSKGKKSHEETRACNPPQTKARGTEMQSKTGDTEEPVFLCISGCCLYLCTPRSLAPTTKARPDHEDQSGRSSIIGRRRRTLPPGGPGSTIRAAGFHFRVRDGIGWIPRAIATGHQSGPDTDWVE